MHVGFMVGFKGFKDLHLRAGVLQIQREVGARNESGLARPGPGGSRTGTGQARTHQQIMGGPA